jgi:rhodanese-related sulfurtransferase
MNWRGWLGVWAVSVSAAGTLDWATVKADLARRYPQVRLLAAEELAGWLKDSRRVPPLLLDVRAPAEYAVSHLPGARRVDPAARPARVLAGVPRETPIVVYCSVGYRSSRFAERLRRAGFTQVWQLDGSLFGWANAGYPLAQGDRPATKVHPFNEHWGQLLDADRRAR